LTTPDATGPEPGTGPPPPVQLDFLLDVLRCLPIGLILVDDAGRIVYANRLAQEIRGVGTRVGGTLSDCHPGKALGALHRVLDRFRSAPADHQHPIVVQRGTRWQVWYARGINLEGQFRGMIWLAQDVGPQKDLQRRLLHQERLASVGRMSGWLAHEVKNALNIVSGALHNLRAMVQGRSDEREMTDIIHDQVQRLSEFIDRLRQLSRPLEARPQACDIVALTREAVRAQASQHDGCEFQLDVQDQPGEVHLDPTLVRRLLDNGLANAARAAGPMGRVQVDVRLDTRPHGEWVVFEIADDGEGVPEEVMDHLFEPFVTTYPDGTGLGLPIMREICRLHGGDLEVANSPEGGARVTARLLSR
jgi:signal transduction histidine kinase